MWADRRISKLEDSSNEIIQSEEPKEKKQWKSQTRVSETYGAASNVPTYA